MSWHSSGLCFLLGVVALCLTCSIAQDALPDNINEACLRASSLAALLSSGWPLEPVTASPPLGKNYRWVTVLSSTSTSRSLAASLFRRELSFCDSPAFARLFVADPVHFQDTVVFEPPQRRLPILAGEQFQDHVALDDLFEAVALTLSRVVILVVDKFDRSEQVLLGHLVQTAENERHLRAPPLIAVVHTFAPQADLRKESLALSRLLPYCPADGFTKCVHLQGALPVHHFLISNLSSGALSGLHSLFDAVLPREMPLSPLEALVSSLNSSLVSMVVHPSNFSLEISGKSQAYSVRTTLAGHRLDLLSWSQIVSLVFDDGEPRFSMLRRISNKGAVVEIKIEVHAVGLINSDSVTFGWYEDGVYLLSYERQFTPLELLQTASPDAWKFYRRGEAHRRVDILVGVPKGTVFDSDTLRVTRVQNSLLVEIATSPLQLTPLEVHASEVGEVTLLYEPKDQGDGSTAALAVLWWFKVSVVLLFFLSALILALLLKIRRVQSVLVSHPKSLKARALEAATFQTLDFLNISVKKNSKTN